VLVECGRCGAPLDVPASGQRYAECVYCGNVTRLRGAKTLSLETPRDWEPPTSWRPPPEAPASSKRVLKRRRRRGRPWGWILVGRLLRGVTQVALLCLVLALAFPRSVPGGTRLADGAVAAVARAEEQLGVDLRPLLAALGIEASTPSLGGDEGSDAGNGEAAGDAPLHPVAGCRCRLDVDGVRGRERVRLLMGLAPPTGPATGRAVRAVLALDRGAEGERWSLPLTDETTPPARWMAAAGGEDEGGGGDGSLVFGLACRDDLVLLVDDRRATAWSLVRRKALWSTPVDAPRLAGGRRGRLNDGGPPTRCVPLAIRDGFLELREQRSRRRIRLRDGARR